jgi:hypothetical protein
MVKVYENLPKLIKYEYKKTSLPFDDQFLDKRIDEFLKENSLKTDNDIITFTEDQLKQIENWPYKNQKWYRFVVPLDEINS